MTAAIRNAHPVNLLMVAAALAAIGSGVMASRCFPQWGPDGMERTAITAQVQR